MRKLPLPPPEDDEGNGFQRVIAMYDFTAKEDTDLTIKQVLTGQGTSTTTNWPLPAEPVEVSVFLMRMFVCPQGEEYIILHKQDQLWWRAQDQHGYIRKLYFTWNKTFFFNFPFPHSRF